MEYENVSEAFIQTIFESGLLLDGHVQLLTLSWKPVPIERSNYKKLCLISVTSLAGCIIALYKRSTFLGTASMIPLGIEVSRIVYSRQRCRQYMEQFSLLVTSFQGIYRLIKNTLSHYHLRKANINSLSSPVRKVCDDLILDSMLTFLTDVGQIVFKYILFISSSLKQIKDKIDIGSLNDIFVIYLDFESFQFDTNSEESVLKNYDKIDGAFIYATSKFLCACGLSICKNVWESDNSQFPKLLSLLLPEYIRYTSGVYETLEATFGSICNNVNRGSIDNVPKNPEKPIINTVSSLREQLRMSFYVTIAVQQHLINSNDNSGFEIYLDDLAAVFTQSNDILKVFQYDIHKDPTAIIETPKPVQKKKKKKCGIPLVKHDDKNGHGSEDSDEERVSHLNYRQLLQYVKCQRVTIGLLNEELIMADILEEENNAVPDDGTPTNQFEFFNDTYTPESESPSPPPLYLGDFSLSTPTLISNNLVEQMCAAVANRGMVEMVFDDHTIWTHDLNDEE